MRTRVAFFVALTALPSVTLACKCPTFDPSELQANFQRIALVQVVELGPEFIGRSPILNQTARNRIVRVRILESFAGGWAKEETVEETLGIGDFNFECSLHPRVGDKFILLMQTGQSAATGCNTRAPEPTLIEALRAKRKGA
jgi:hypothetical protein